MTAITDRLNPLEQIRLPLEPAIHRRIGAHVIFVVAKGAAEKAHQPAAHLAASLRVVTGTRLVFDLRHLADVQPRMHGEIHIREGL